LQNHTGKAKRIWEIGKPEWNSHFLSGNYNTRWEMLFPAGKLWFLSGILKTFQEIKKTNRNS
jgi:hypothetical protein